MSATAPPPNNTPGFEGLNLFGTGNVSDFLREQFNKSTKILQDTQESNQKQSKELRDRIIHKRGGNLDPKMRAKLDDIQRTLEVNPDLIDPVGLFMGTLVVKARENRDLVTKNPELILELNKFLNERVAVKNATKTATVDANAASVANTVKVG